MKPTPPGWPRISTALFYEDPRKAIAWLCDAFGFEIRIVVDGEGGSVEHSELTYGEGLIMVARSGGRPDDAPSQVKKSPRAVGGVNTQAMALYVDDVEAHLARARAAGAKIITEPRTSDYGEEYWSDRSYEAEDPEGHRWWFMQRLRTGATPG
jgi:uncharacterized glyoxalase superfamily protein PhnB